jgi:hypothetical protein
MKTAQLLRGTYISAPSDGLLFVIERASRRSQRLVASVMPESLPYGDSLLPSLRYVPPAIRREARAHLLGVLK